MLQEYQELLGRGSGLHVIICISKYSIYFIEQSLLGSLVKLNRLEQEIFNRFFQVLCTEIVTFLDQFGVLGLKSS